MKRGVSPRAMGSSKTVFPTRPLSSAGATHRIEFAIDQFPVRLSDCFNNFGRRRIESVKYKTWKAKVDAALVKVWRDVMGNPYAPVFSKPVRVLYTVQKPDNRKRDLDNLLKSLNDTLTRLSIVADDSLISDLTIRWGIPRAGEVYVEVESL